MIHKESNQNPLIRCSSCFWFRGHFGKKMDEIDNDSKSINLTHRDNRRCGFYGVSVSTTYWCEDFKPIKSNP